MRRRRWIWYIISAHVFLYLGVVGASRVYIGAHFPHQIVLGLLVGLRQWVPDDLPGRRRLEDGPVRRGQWGHLCYLRVHLFRADGPRDRPSRIGQVGPGCLR
uniref:Putative pap2 like 3 protein n=1 Tax=Ixodes ricinus TaxID=34613 RepID=A0A0K8R593_IXORI